MKLIERSLRPLQCVRAMASSGMLSSPSGALVGAAERVTRAAIQLAGRLRASGLASRVNVPEPLDAPRVSHVEPVRSPFRKDGRRDQRRDQVDEASWESFPASDPPAY